MKEYAFTLNKGTLKSPVQKDGRTIIVFSLNDNEDEYRLSLSLQDYENMINNFSDILGFKG